MVGSGRGQGGAGGGGGYYYSTLQAVSLSASLSPHLFLPSSSWLLLACSPHSTPAHLAFAAAVAPAPSNPPCARATGREQGSCARTAYAAFFRLDQIVPVWHLAQASAHVSCTVLSPPTPHPLCSHHLPRCRPLPTPPTLPRHRRQHRSHPSHPHLLLLRRNPLALLPGCLCLLADAAAAPVAGRAPRCVR